MEIEINLFANYVAMLKNELVANGFQFSGTESDEEIAIGFLNWQKRKVSAVPRTVNYSREFQCPPEFQAAIDAIRNAIQQGQDITPYLSKKIKDFDYSDAMLNDWGIHHMHLGQTTDASGFIKRTGPLLFAKFTQSDVYFINVFSHGGWAKQEIVKIIHDNWPATIEQHKIKGVVSLGFKPSDDEITSLRNANMNTMLELDDGTIYAPIGMGYMANGTSTEVMMQYMRTRRSLVEAEKKVREAASANPSDFTGIPKPKFFLEINNGHGHAVEQSTRVAYKLW